jgi:hypothetical protein
MEWRDSLNYLNTKNQLKNFDMNLGNYVSGNCSGIEGTYLNPDKCGNARQYVQELVDRKIKDAQASQNTTAESARKELEDRKKNKGWKDTYPFNSHDFDYKTYVTNVFNPFSLGITNNPSMSTLIQNGTKMGNYIGALLTTPTPAEGTIPGISDINPNDTELSEIKKEYEKMPLPYPTFRKDYPEAMYPVEGRGASSYFLRMGNCPSSAKTKEECEARGYNWVDNPPSEYPDNSDLIDKSIRSGQVQPINKTDKEAEEDEQKPKKGKCFKPRFMYVNNEAKGHLNLKGLGPSVVRDIVNMNPDDFIASVNGYSTPIGGALPCIEDFQTLQKEDYKDYRNINKQNMDDLQFPQSVYAMSHLAPLNTSLVPTTQGLCNPNANFCGAKSNGSGACDISPVPKCSEPTCLPPVNSSQQFPPFVNVPEGSPTLNGGYTKNKQNVVMLFLMEKLRMDREEIIVLTLVLLLIVLVALNIVRK